MSVRCAELDALLPGQQNGEAIASPVLSLLVVCCWSEVNRLSVEVVAIFRVSIHVLRPGRNSVKDASGKDRRPSRHYAIVSNVDIWRSTSEIASREVYALAVLQMNTAIKERTARNDKTVVNAFHPNSVAGITVDMVKYTV